MYSIRNIVSNIVITMYGASWVLDLPGGSLQKVIAMLYTGCPYNIACHLQLKNKNNTLEFK